ncbi:unnamed protein product, partial [Closterium sp. Yama58-4]
MIMARSHGVAVSRRSSLVLAALVALMLSGVLACSQVCSHALRRALMLSGVLECSQVCSHALRYALMLSGMLSCSQVCSHALRCALMLSGVLSCSQVCSHALRYALMLSESFPPPLSVLFHASYASKPPPLESIPFLISSSHPPSCLSSFSVCPQPQPSSALCECAQGCCCSPHAFFLSSHHAPSPPAPPAPLSHPLSACAPRAAAVRLPAASNAANHSCVQRKCGANAVCMKERGDATCVCNIGFSMTPTGCVDTCALKACGGNATCTKNSAGVASCVCASGFVLQADKRTCTDTCALKACGGNATCIKDSAGVASCVCGAGFVLQADGRTCTDTCTLKACGVNSRCIKFGTTPSCLCYPGFELQADGRTCNGCCRRGLLCLQHGLPECVGHVCGYVQVQVALTDVQVALTDVQVALTDVQVALTDVQVALTDVQVGLTDVQVVLTDIHVALTDAQSTLPPRPFPSLPPLSFSMFPGIDPCGGCPAGATCTATASGGVPYCICPPGYGLTSTGCISGKPNTVCALGATRAILRADGVPGGAGGCAAVYAFPGSSWCIGPKTALRPPVNGTGGSIYYFGYPYSSFSCVAAETCATKSCGGNGTCVEDSAGVASCVCNAGFLLQSDGTTCAEACGSKICDPTTDCVRDAAGGATCVCKAGYQNISGKCV